MLIAENCGGLRFVAVLALSVAVVGCTTEATPTPSPTPAPQSLSQAADLRVHLDLLLSEQAMIVAKESAAAVNHSDDYASYTSLLATNSADLTALIARAFGNSAATQFAQLWNAQDGYLVDYAIGLVTHDQAKASAAMTSINGAFTPQFAQLVTSLSRLPLDLVSQLTSQQVLEDKAFIDDLFAGNYTTYYTDLRRAYTHTSRLGDALASQITLDFPDKFPGDAATNEVELRVGLNQLLQEHSYLATMATDATINGRDADRGGALNALAANTAALSSVVQDSRFAQAWSQEALSIAAYALKGDATSRQGVTNTAATQITAVTKAPPRVIADHEAAVIKVIDDQRAKATAAVADDDRAAATSMQPIADSIR